MLIEKDDNGTIIKLNVSSGFLNIKQAFVFSSQNESGEYTNDVVGKICFEFGKYTSASEKKLKDTVKYYMSIEDAALFAELLKTGKMVVRCKKAKESNPYGSGFSDMAGTTTSKQLKIQQGDKEDKFFIKALEGPGEKNDKGLMVPKYNDKTATKSIAITVSIDQLMKIGLAIERAIRIYDNLLAQGLDAVIRYSDKMRYHGEQSQPKPQGQYSKAPQRPQRPQPKMSGAYITPNAPINGAYQRPEDIF